MDRWIVFRDVVWPFLRDVILFFGGLIGIYHETFVVDFERPSLLVVFAGMLGLTVLLRADEKIRNGKQD